MKIKTQRIFKSNLIKGLIVLVFGMSVFVSFAQPTVLGTQTVNGSYVTYDLALRGAARFVRLNASSGASSGARNWEFVSGTASSTNYSINWRPYTSGQTLSGYNTQIDPSSATASARYNTGWGGQSGLMPAITSGRYYTFIVGTNTSSNNFMSVLETTYNPVTLSSTRNITNPNPNQAVTITVNLSGTKNANERVFVRWSTDGFSSNNNFIEITSFTSNVGTATIPAQASGTISYYILSTEQLTLSATDIDYFSLNLDNNSNSNYTYIVTNNRWETATSGNWSSFSTWGTTSTIPNSSSNVIVNNSNNLTLDQDATVSSLTNNSGGTFTASDNTIRTLTLSNSTNGTSTTIANSGTWSNGVGGSTVTFTGAPSSGDAIHNVTGTIAFRNVIINKTSGSSNVGAFFNAGQTLTNSIEIGTGGYVSEDVANFYGASTTLIFNQGTGANYDVNNADNTWPNSNPAPNITVNSGTVTINTARFVTAGGTLTVASGATLASGGNLTIKSDATGTASIGNSAGNISGSVTVERYVSGAGRRWRFLSSPVQSATVANWMSQFYVTGPGDGVTTSPSNTLGAAMSTGWNCSQANILYPSTGSDYRRVQTTSIRTYNESASGNNTNLNAGWENLSSTSQALIPGQGFRVFIRGAANNTGQLDGSVTSQSAVTLALTGTVNQGSITLNSGSTFPITNATQGWNLIGNPYPCAYNIAAHYTGNLNSLGANCSTIVYIYNPITGVNAYAGYNANGGTASGTGLSAGIIPSGGAFFIKATSGSPTFTFQEAYKTTTAPLSLHKTIVNNQFEIKYYKDTVESDYLTVKMYDGATLNYDAFDILKIRNDNLNLAAYGEDTMQVAATVIQPISEETRIKLNVEATQIGTYNFEFNNMDNFDAGVSVHLFDRFTNTTTDVKANTKYTFEMGAGVNQWGKNRFELILNKSTTGVENISNTIASTNLTVFPNPATDVLNINISNSSFKNSQVVVYNVSGMEVSKSTMNGASAQLNIESLSNGVYFVKVSNENGFSKTVKFVK